jgi:hypothetical protein
LSFDDIVERVKNVVINEMDGKKFLQSGSLVNKVALETGYDHLSVRQALGRLVKVRWLTGFAPNGTPLGQVTIIGEIPEKRIDPTYTAWENALKLEDVKPEELSSLLPCYKKFQGMSDQDMRLVVRGLIRLKNDQAQHVGKPMFLVSAQYLLASSKLLGELPAKNLNKFGINTGIFTKHLPYVVVGGSSDPKTVVLIENPASFEMAVNSQAASNCAFISTFGFGLSHSNSEHGYQLANIVETGFAKCITLTREGSQTLSAKELLLKSNITFWGDLDTSGLHIYLRLKAKLPNLKLSALYKPMLEALNMDSCSHPYVDLTKKSGQLDLTPLRDIDHEISRLLNLVSERGVDQEHISSEQIEEFAEEILS